jgi:tetratricopeptide (TPR) repeat protein
VHRLLAKRPEERPADGGEAGRLLDVVVSGHPTEQATGADLASLTPAAQVTPSHITPATTPTPAPAPPGSTTSLGQGPRWWAAATVTGAVVALVAGGVIMSRDAVPPMAEATATAAPATAAQGPRRLVVLSFREAGPEVQAGVGEMLASAVGHALAGGRRMTLVSPLLVRAAAHDEGLASFSETAAAERARGVLARLDASAVLTADVQANGDVLEVVASLTSLPDYGVLATFRESTPRGGPQIGKVSSSLARQIRQHFDAQSKSRPALAMTSNLEAYSAYLRGVDELNVKADYAEAVKHFERTVELDPDFAMGWSELSCSLSFLGDESRNEQLKRATERADELKQQLPEPMRLLLEGNVAWARNESEGALAKYSEYAEKYPDDRTAHFYMGMAARYLAKDMDGARRSLLKARALTPSYLPVTRELVWLAVAQEDRAQAIQWARELTEQAPRDARGWVMLANELANEGQNVQAKTALRRAVELDANVDGAAELGKRL